ncbi:hypothetical protein ACWPKS_09770 [Coraliomargarita sp. W4R72]
MKTTTVQTASLQRLRLLREWQKKTGVVHKSLLQFVYQLFSRFR